MNDFEELQHLKPLCNHPNQNWSSLGGISQQIHSIIRMLATIPLFFSSKSLL